MIKKIIPDGPRPDNSTPLTYKNKGIKVIGPAKIIKSVRLMFVKLKSLLFVLIIKYKATITMGSINKLSIRSPISVSTLIFFLKRLYELQNVAIPNPAQGIDGEFSNKYKLEIATKEIEINLFLLSFSFKKRYPKKTLIIGKIK